MWIYTLVDYSTGSPVSTVVKEPIGWDKLTIKYVRDKKYHGFFDFLDDSLAAMQFRNFTGSPAMTILEDAYNTYGVEAHVDLNLSYQCNEGATIIDMYTARLDFTRYEKHEGLEGCWVEVGGLNGSAYYKFKNRIDQAVNLNSLVSFDKALLTNQSIVQADLITLQLAYYDFNGSLSTLVGAGAFDLSNAIAGGVSSEIYVAYTMAACVSAIQAATIAGAPNLIGTNADLSQATSFGLSEQYAPDAPTAAAIAAAALAIQTTINGLTSPTTQDIVDVIYTYIAANALSSYNSVASTTGIDATATASVYAGYATVYASVAPTGDLPAYPGLGYELPLLNKSITYAEYWTGTTYGIGDTFCGTGGTPAYIPNETCGTNLSLIWDDLTGGNNTTATAPGTLLDYLWSCSIDDTYTVSGKFKGTIVFNAFEVSCGGTPLTGFQEINDLIVNSVNYGKRVGLMIGVTDPSVTGFLYVELLGTSDIIADWSTATSPTINFDIDISQSLTLTATQSLKIYWLIDYERNDTNYSGTVAAQYDFSYTEKNLYVKRVTTFPVSTGQVFMVNEALSRIAESLTESELKVYSDYFGRPDALPYPSASDGCGGLECISNGRFLRQALLANDGTLATMSISFADLFRDLDGIHRLGMGLEDDPNRTGYQLLRVESEDYFYQNTTALTLPNVNLLSTAHDGASDISTVDIGYPNWQCWDINGLDEWNTQRKYRTTLQSTTNNKDITCKMVTSGYAIEFTRRQGGGSSDWRYDNMNFLICLRRVAIPVYPQPFPDITIDGFNLDIATQVNIIPENAAPTYNARISPARVAMNWVRAIFRSYQDYLNGQLIYTWGDGNYLAKFQPTDPTIWACEKTSNLLGENQLLDYTVFDTPSDNYPLFKNELVTFEYPLTIDQFLTIKTNPYKKIGYSVNNGATRYGWIEQMSYTPQIDGSTHAFMARFTLRPQIT